MKKYFFVSTAIDYVNAPAHCGHALEKIQADAIARYHRLLGEDVFFLTGTDENSLKNVRAAEKAKIPVKEWVDRIAKKFHELKGALNLSFDDFIRTTEPRHIKGAQKLWLACKDDIYEKEYKGLYCVECEEFYKENELVKGLCPEHKTKPEFVAEENYFFKLSKYQERLKEIIENDQVKIIPKKRKNEVLRFMDSGLRDICISRSNERARGWGVDVPGDPSQKMWCWIDALANYITALGYGENSQKFQDFWQKNDNKIHIIGKGISRFHAVYWLGFLLSANLALPEIIFVHGYITVNGQKMSKTLGNVIDPFELVNKYDTDPVRYFFLREIPSTEDGDFSYEKFETRYNADLANGVGNLVSRILKMTKNSQVPEMDIKGTKESEKTIDRIWSDALKEGERPYTFPYFVSQVWLGWKKELNDLRLDLALERIVTLVSILDKRIEEEKPFKLFKEDMKKAGYIMYDLLESLRHIAWMFLPFMPETADKIFEQLGLDPEKEKEKKLAEAIKWGGLKSGTKIKFGKPLFPRIE